MSLYIVDCEAPYGLGSPAVTDMIEFGAVHFDSLETFHGKDCNPETFSAFRDWLKLTSKGRPVFVSDNPAYDWQWINYYFWKYFNSNPFGHSARRIGDFAAGLNRDFYKASEWKSLRKTKHDHNPVNDALGNAEALRRLIDISNRKS